MRAHFLADKGAASSFVCVTARSIARQRIEILASHATLTLLRDDNRADPVVLPAIHLELLTLSYLIKLKDCVFSLLLIFLATLCLTIFSTFAHYNPRM
mmetsp:Transcript_26834/g.35889  ORF Transcript_26834/g.35889 Transcript_26834/m.35889 type:complete len:98 (-) Transcript_26834:1311-1604(-)